MTDKQLSPAAQAVMVAATNGNFNVVNDSVYKQCIAAALREVVRQLKYIGITDKNILAIANELEGK